MIDVCNEFGISKFAECMIYAEFDTGLLERCMVDVESYNKRYSVPELYEQDLFIINVMEFFCGCMGHAVFEWMPHTQEEFRCILDKIKTKFYTITKELSLVGVEYVIA